MESEFFGNSSREDRNHFQSSQGSRREEALLLGQRLMTFPRSLPQSYRSVDTFPGVSRDLRRVLESGNDWETGKVNLLEPPLP